MYAYNNFHSLIPYPITIPTVWIMHAILAAAGSSAAQVGMGGVV